MVVRNKSSSNNSYNEPFIIRKSFRFLNYMGAILVLLIIIQIISSYLVVSYEEIESIDIHSEIHSDIQTEQIKNKSLIDFTSDQSLNVDILDNTQIIENNGSIRNVKSVETVGSVGSVGSVRSVRSVSSQKFDINTEYLIIAPQDFIPEIEPLANWKSQKGVYTSIVSLDGPGGINSSYDGSDLAERIHTFLMDYYNYTQTLKWLLLVGDSEIIPARLLLTNISNNASLGNINNYCYSDYYYSSLTTNWDNNANTKFGEVGEEDWVPELYVGRLPVNTRSEAADAVTKILAYEQNPPNGDWFNTTIQCGALMDRPNVLDDLATITIDEGYNDYKDNAREAIHNVQRYFSNTTNNLTYLDYDREDGGFYSKTNDTLNRSNVLFAYNQGASTINFVSHGDGNGVRHYSGNGVTKIEFASEHYFNHDDAKKLENGDKLPFIYSSSCTSANFTETDDSNLERLVTSPENGAIGFIGATTDTYRLEYYINDSSYGNWWLDSEFWRRFYTGEGDFRPGEILYRLKADYYLHYSNESHNPHTKLSYQRLYRTNLFAYNLLGDPEVPIYTEVPKKLRVQHPQKILPINRNHQLTIKVFENGNNIPVANADVCIIGKNTYLVGQTDSMGVSRFDFKIKDEEILNVTVTGHNYYYYEGSIEIEARQDLKLTQDDIKFDMNPIPPGAMVNITVRVTNNGESDLSNVEVNCFADQISTENLIVDPIIIDSLVKGEYENISFNWTPGPGSHNVSIVLDYKDEIFEFNESNNIVSILLVENKPPIWLSLPQKLILEDTPVINAIDLESYAWDEDTTELQFDISNVTPLGFNMSINNSKLSLIPPLNWNGIAGALVIVSDGTSIDQEYITIIVDPVNDKPNLNDTIDWIILSDNITLTPGKITVFEDTDVKVKLVASDIADNNSNLIFACETNLFIINSTTGIFSFTPTNSMVGVYTINYSVDDGALKNNVAWRWITLEILNDNDPPEIKAIEKHFVKVGEKFTLNINAIDIDQNDNLIFSDDSEFFDINSLSGEINFTPNNKHIGIHRIIIMVTDGNASVTKEFILEIGPKSDDPVDPNYVILCPIIIIIIIILLFIQELIRNKKNREKQLITVEQVKEGKESKEIKESREGRESREIREIRESKESEERNENGGNKESEESENGDEGRERENKNDELIKKRKGKRKATKTTK